jgi:hypothetical protein
MRILTRTSAALALFIAVVLGGASPARACSPNQEECGSGPHPNATGAASR